jgi:hypothetical protein
MLKITIEFSFDRCSNSILIYDVSYFLNSFSVIEGTAFNLLSDQFFFSHCLEFQVIFFLNHLLLLLHSYLF